jgi:hypothetical protein
MSAWVGQRLRRASSGPTPPAAPLSPCFRSCRTARPAWNGNGATLTPVLPGTTSPQGNTVASIFGAYFSDPGATSMGIAVSGVTGTKSGQRYYSTDSGATYQELPTVSATKALLLSANDLLAFVPNTGFLGTATLTAYAWDGRPGSGSAGGTVKLGARNATGGTTAFSGGTLAATCLVNTALTLIS